MYNINSANYKSKVRFLAITRWIVRKNRFFFCVNFILNESRSSGHFLFRWVIKQLEKQSLRFLGASTANLSNQSQLPHLQQITKLANSTCVHFQAKMFVTESTNERLKCCILCWLSVSVMLDSFVSVSEPSLPAALKD